MDKDKFNIEGELRAGRSRPRDDFASELAGQVREASGRARQSRVGLMLALCGLIVVAVFSFGGMGYASSSKPAKAVKSAASAQYNRFTPKVKAQVAAQTKTKPAAVTPKATKAQLPFTGLALWVPLAAGLMLIALGLVLRTRGKRQGESAHS